MKAIVYMRGSLSPEEGEKLETAKERGLRSRAWLVGQIVRQWLNDPQRKMSADPLIAGVGRLTLAQRRIALRRLDIIDRWKRTVAALRRRGVGKNAATTSFLKQLTWRNRVSRRTLYLWALRYQGHGLAGLVDGRAIRNSGGHRKSI